MKIFWVPRSIFCKNILFFLFNLPKIFSFWSRNRRQNECRKTNDPTNVHRPLYHFDTDSSCVYYMHLILFHVKFSYTLLSYTICSIMIDHFFYTSGRRFLSAHGSSYNIHMFYSWHCFYFTRVVRTLNEVAIATYLYLVVVYNIPVWLCIRQSWSKAFLNLFRHFMTYCLRDLKSCWSHDFLSSRFVNEKCIVNWLELKSWE